MVRKETKISVGKKTKSKKRRIISYEPKHILEARKDIVKDSILPYTTIGVIMLIGVLWMLYAISTIFICGIIGLVVLILSIILISIGLSQSQRITKLKPVIIYEDGVEMPWPGNKKMFFKFADFQKYSWEDRRGYETIMLKKGEDEYPLVLWDNLEVRIDLPIEDHGKTFEEEPEVYNSIFRPEDIEINK
jgi:hypothetical protein